MAINKKHLIESVYNNVGYSKGKSIELVESLLEIMKSTLESGEDLLISGFGKFYIKEKNERRGRNPQAGNDLIIDARRIVTFQCSSILREKMNGKG